MGDEFTFVVLEGDIGSASVLGAQRRTAPAGQDRISVTRWFHDDVHEILDHHQPDIAFFKEAEGNSQTKNLERSQLEGVLMEAGSCHRLRLTIKGRKKSQVRHDTKSDTAAKYITRLAPAAPRGVDRTAFAEAYVAALCGLSPTTTSA